MNVRVVTIGLVKKHMYIYGSYSFSESDKLLNEPSSDVLCSCSWVRRFQETYYKKVAGVLITRFMCCLFRA